MAQAKVAIRLGTEGKDQVVRDFKSVGDAGDAAANRAARSFEKASQDVESAMRRQAAAADKIAAIAPQSSVQQIYQAGASTRYDGPDARSSAENFRALLADQERYERQAIALRAALDPVWAAQQRFNAEMANVDDLYREGAISAELYAQAQARLRGDLDDVVVGHGRVTASSGAMRAGMQQLGFQAQDFAVQVIGGTDAVRAFAMQAPQAIGALQMMGSGADAAKGKFGAFFSLLGGPWGVALGTAIPLALMLGERFLFMGDAADKTSGKLDKQRAVVDRLSGAYDTLAAAMNKAGAKAIEAEGVARVKMLADEANVARLQAAAIVADKALAASQRVDPRGRGSGALVRGAQQARADLQAAQQELETNRRLVQLFGERRAEAEAREAAVAAGKPTSGGAGSRGNGGAARANAGVTQTDPAGSLFVTNDRWARNQDVGATARDLFKQQANDIAEQDRRRADYMANALRDLTEQNQLLDVEALTIGRGNTGRDVAMAKLRVILDLKREGVDLESAEARSIIETTGRMEDKRAAIDNMKAQWASMGQQAEQAISSLFDIRSAESWGSRVKSIILDIINELIRAQAIKALLGSSYSSGGGIGGLLGGLFSAVAGGLGGGSGASLLPKGTYSAAIGSHYMPAGAALVGENGPEIVEMPRGARVLTASDTRRAMGGGGAVSAPVSITIDATGADAAGLARVERQLQQLRAELPGQIVSTVSEAQQRLVLRGMR